MIPKAQQTIIIVTSVSCLFLGALSSVFRKDEVGDYVSVFCISVLTLWLVGRLWKT
jgi:hypothetical protein